MVGVRAKKRLGNEEVGDEKNGRYERTKERGRACVERVGKMKECGPEVCCSTRATYVYCAREKCGAAERT